MTPQHKGIVPPAHVRRLLAAKAAQVDADQGYRAAVVAALKAGASVREVMRVTGLSNDTVTRWGHDGGWPTAQQKAAREETRERRRAFNEIIDRGIEQLRSRPDDDA